MIKFKKNAVHQPPRNTGELLDDEQRYNDDYINSEEEDNVSVESSDIEFGEHPLEWTVDEHAHVPVEPGVINVYGQPLYVFQGRHEGIHQGDILEDIYKEVEGFIEK